MSEYIIWESDKTETTDYLGVKHGVSHFEKREEIVRCRDCTNYEPNDYIHFTCEYLQRWAKPDDYCAWGERIERIEQ